MWLASFAAFFGLSCVRVLAPLRHKLLAGTGTNRSSTHLARLCAMMARSLQQTGLVFGSPQIR